MSKINLHHVLSVVIILGFAIVGFLLLNYGKEKGFENYYKEGRIDGVNAQIRITNPALKSSPYIFVNENQESLSSIHYIIDNRETINKKELADSLNIGILKSIINFYEFEDTLAEQLLATYYQNQENLFGRHQKEYETFLYSLNDISLKPEEKEFKSAGSLSKLICSLIGLVTPIGKSKILAKSRKASKAKVNKPLQEEVSDYVKGEIEENICEAIFENAIRTLAKFFARLTAPKEKFTSKQVVELRSRMVSQLVAKRVGVNFRVEDEILNTLSERNGFIWGYDKEPIDMRFSADVAIGVDLSNTMIELSETKSSDRNLLKLTVTLPEPEILSTFIELDSIVNQDHFARLKGEYISKNFELAHDIANQKVMSSYAIQNAKSSIRTQIRNIYEPLLLNSNSDFRIDVEFTNNNTLKN
jgi:hypothetical protein